jgi:hypothetical protein
MGLLSSLGKLGSNIVGGVGDIVNNPIKAVKDGLQDPATLAALAAAAGGYGLYQSGMLGGGGLGGLFGGAEAVAGAADAGAMAGVMGSAGAGAGTDAVLGSAGGGLGGMLGGWGSFGPSIVQGVTGIYAANQAANAQKDAAGNALAFNQQQAAQTRADLMPYNAMGQGAGASLSNYLGIGKPTDAATFGQMSHQFTPADFLANKDPGYEFQRHQGELALQNSQAAGSGVMSGAAMKGLIDYNQGVASTGYNDAFNRFQTGNQNTYNRLAGLLQVGQNAAAGSGTIGANLAGNSSNAIMAGGNAAASGLVGTANAVNGAISNYQGMNLAQQLLQQQQRQPSTPNAFTGPG